ncbi:MAG TPA: neutral zinc metallopeptidase [bacterium]|nr:neutral zinc metallopeptidase [bacterium]
MKWKGRRQSEHLEDRRGMPVAAVGGVGAFVVLLIGAFLGVDVRPLLDAVPPPQQAPAPGSPGGAPNEINDEDEAFVATVLADTEEVFTAEFRRQLGREYEKPRLVMFSERVQSRCGIADAAVGPFYCPLDKQVYLDTSFYVELDRRLGAPGDFAQAYVIAHEVGHHIQQITGVSDQVRQLQQRARSQAEANALSVRLELQADYLAGVWAHHAQQNWQILEPGDIEEALGAASAIGDDRLQKRGQGYVNPDSFTHGTSEQRVRWFRKGLETGKIDMDNTFRGDV